MLRALKTHYTIFEMMFELRGVIGRLHKKLDSIEASIKEDLERYADEIDCDELTVMFLEIEHQLNSEAVKIRKIKESLNRIQEGIRDVRP